MLAITSRADVTALLHHFHDFERRYTVPIAPRDQTAGWIAAELRRRRAGETVTALSDDEELDGGTWELDAALAATVGWRPGTLLIARPGHLAYYEGEDERLILHRG